MCICLSVGVFFVCQDDFSFGALLRSGELPKRSGPPVDQHIMQQNLVCTLFFHRSGSNVICQNTHENLSPAVAFCSCFFLNNLDLSSKLYIPSTLNLNLTYIVAYTIDCVCSKMLNHGLNHGFFLSRFMLIPCLIH